MILVSGVRVPLPLLHGENTIFSVESLSPLGMGLFLHTDPGIFTTGNTEDFFGVRKRFLILSPPPKNSANSVVKK